LKSPGGAWCPPKTTGLPIQDAACAILVVPIHRLNHEKKFEHHQNITRNEMKKKITVKKKITFKTRGGASICSICFNE
jgi:hypothetical protein